MKPTFQQELQIGNKLISPQSKTYIIAEAGVNHNGDMEIAYKMIDEISKTGVDAIKFQMFYTEELILSDIEKAPYQKETTEKSETQYEMLKKLELGLEQYEILQAYCKEKGIDCLVTPFEEFSLNQLEKLDLSAYKIAATDLTNIKFLRQVAQKGRPIILSAGMCYLEEVRVALDAIRPINQQVILLQCTANYPIKDEEVNLELIPRLRDEFKIVIGYSDHSVGIGASPYAVVKGAKVIEKHVTLDRTMEGPDQGASVTVEELRQLVEEIRKVETYLGTDIKTPTISEQNTRKSLQKCLVASKSIQQGECFTEENVTAKRTNGVGISALYYDEVIGKCATKDYVYNDILLP
ncbi:MAG: N-acetylneuraminate synthase family protein [Eubacteriales bacterium]